jgi:hypothetical protein
MRWRMCRRGAMFIAAILILVWVLALLIIGLRMGPVKQIAEPTDAGAIAEPSVETHLRGAKQGMLHASSSNITLLSAEYDVEQLKRKLETAAKTVSPFNTCLVSHGQLNLTHTSIF